ncbi:TolB family protein [Fulvivirga sedimenti]|uniref:Biopolymer transporter TolR n=1 Tax=Fulvivirga sedimenti TaxID=2879465 RepID=A0A9X1L205_9BACT|nr:biopolymer transporter TolR [Fulvivirga sedimenti]MCA6078797.1 biopolymer transporter TolR [Fulvivirga sedimenti]
MNFNKLHFTKLFIFLMFVSIHSYAQDKDYGIFESSTDVGAVKNAGSVVYDSENQSYTISGSGTNMWGEKDEFRYLWTTLQGDFILRAEMHFIGEGVDPHRKIGWTVRNTLSSGSAMVNAAVHGDGLTSLQYRKTADAETLEVKSTDTAPDIIQLSRIGGTYYMSTARKGESFTTVELTDISLRNEVFAGIYVCSHNPDVTEHAVFKNVRIIKPAPADLVPYRNYLGSRMEVLDIESGTRKVLFESEHSLQAPNWTPDGKNLIYNSNGYLYRYYFENGEVEYLNTGFATSNNNDHVLSFDGEMLGISHHNAADDNASTIYLMPSTGSDNPRQVSMSGQGASYLHGISPDKKTVIFTGNRKGKYDIYAADTETMEETQLTDTPGLDDGSEFSGDGRYIYFNSDRTGTMQLWRMNADGSEPTQLTFDENFNDWFPHVSPDGKWIVFLSFGTDVRSDDHPFYKHVTLRLMPVEGGTPRIIAYVYGGQGTINVPSWSPDSRKIAFVSNSGRFY